MLRPEEFAVGSFPETGDDELTLMLPRRRHEEAILITGAAGEKIAVYLGQHNMMRAPAAIPMSGRACWFPVCRSSWTRRASSTLIVKTPHSEPWFGRAPASASSPRSSTTITSPERTGRSSRRSSPMPRPRFRRLSEAVGRPRSGRGQAEAAVGRRGAPLVRLKWSAKEGQPLRQLAQMEGLCCVLTSSASAISLRKRATA